MYLIAGPADHALINVRLVGRLQPVVDAQAGYGASIHYSDHKPLLARTRWDALDLAQSQRGPDREPVSDIDTAVAEKSESV
jgi:hypothetical protein